MPIVSFYIHTNLLVESRIKRFSNPFPSDTFPSLTIDGTKSADWEFVRRTANYQHTGPLQNVYDNAIRCYEGSGRPEAAIASIAAGSKLDIGVYYSITHPGPVLFYMAKVPAGKTAADWDGSGNVWFKIDEMAPSVSASGLSWPSDGMKHSLISVANVYTEDHPTVLMSETHPLGLNKLTTTIPSSLPDGDYLIRVEHIALHSAGGQGGAQFYLACGQLTVTNGGSGSPSPLVSFPGAYSPTDPGIMINLDWPIPTSYTMPGPPVWKA